MAGAVTAFATTPLDGGCSANAPLDAPACRSLLASSPLEPV